MHCEHITNCVDCDLQVCSYCVEDCSGCQKERCKECYKKHQTCCNDCLENICPKEVELVEAEDDTMIQVCPKCKMVDEQL